MTLTFTFPGCWVHIDVAGNYLQTVFPDGTCVTGVPMPQKDSDTARRYGYGDDWMRLWREHDLLHHWVAVQFGLPYSPTIWSECHPEHPDALPPYARLEEEEFVADVHRWLNLHIWAPSLDALGWRRPDIPAMREEIVKLLNHELFCIPPQNQQ